jgi:hypothetical protein
MAIRQWLQTLVARHVVMSAYDHRATAESAQWAFSATLDSAPGLAVDTPLRGHAVAEVRHGKVAALTLTVDTDTIQRRSRAAAAAIAATMAAYDTKPATASPDPTGETRETRAALPSAPAREPQPAWLIAALLGLAGVAFYVSVRRGPRARR